MIKFGLTTLTFVAATPPNVTVEPAEKFEPEMLTCVPPVSGPSAGETEVIVGTGAGLTALKLSTDNVPAETESAVAVPMRISNLTLFSWTPLPPLQLRSPYRRCRC